MGMAFDPKPNEQQYQHNGKMLLSSETANLMAQQQPLSSGSQGDFSNLIGSFSNKSAKTVDESNQSVAQELKTNESIAM